MNFLLIKYFLKEKQKEINFKKFFLEWDPQMTMNYHFISKIHHMMFNFLKNSLDLKN